MNNRDIAAILFNISTLLIEHRSNPYRIRAYRNAARNILRAPYALAERANAGEPLGIPGLGKRLTAKITQMAREGHSDFYDELCADLPSAEQALLKVPGIGPKLANRVARDLRVTEADDLLKRAASLGLQQIWGIGPKRATIILEQLVGTPAVTTPHVVREGNVLYIQEELWKNDQKQAA